MKKTAKVLLAVLVIITVIAPLGAIMVSSFLIPPQYSDTFVGVLDEKLERLTSIEEEKIVIVGGSSVAFGIDSELMENELGRPVVNFGLYAALGTKLMLDLSKAGIKKGDVVILAPELDAQTLSLYFSAENTLNAIDDDKSILKYIPSEHYVSLFGGSWRFASDKFSYWFNNNAPDPEGIYNADSFDEYLDIKEGLRPQNVMKRYYDPNTVIDLSPSIVSDDFIDYLNEYIAWCESQGASVFFTWCPINSAALKEGTTNATLSEFSSYIEYNIDCEIISDLMDDYYGPIMDKAYFYDTNFHLNDAGVIRRSINLVNDIHLALDDGEYCLLDLPDPPPLPEVNIRYDGFDENEKYFTYELIKNELGEVISQKVVGLTEEGKAMTTLTLPVGIEGYIVTEIGAEVFKNSAVKTLIIPENSRCETIGNGAFDGSAITKLYILKAYQNNGAPDDLIIPPASFPPLSSGFRIYVPSADDYKSGYHWGDVANVNELLITIEK